MAFGGRTQEAFERNNWLKPEIMQSSRHLFYSIRHLRVFEECSNEDVRTVLSLSGCAPAALKDVT